MMYVKWKYTSALRKKYGGCMECGREIKVGEIAVRQYKWYWKRENLPWAFGFLCKECAQNISEWG